MLDGESKSVWYTKTMPYRILTPEEQLPLIRDMLRNAEIEHYRATLLQSTSGAHESQLEQAQRTMEKLGKEYDELKAKAKKND